ncbi:ATP-binding protein [Pseudorhodobacter aquimaris]|uniref:ATP-binding protein n=1 Tax=Pseudorhodobacter aquimaris TaxID=687412 RepID=UPI000B289E47|nr:AAA family ATPase [Pseudorhodobacter aquimaris]
MYPRFARARIEEALSDTRVVLISGPRQSGKTTLAMDIAADKTPFLTLDDATVLEAAINDPVGFVRGLERAVIDEVQRAPDLLLAIKNVVDDHQSPGRFLLTGSANLMTIPKVADSLAGRMEVIRLFPLSQAEIIDSKSQFIDRAFAGEKPIANHVWSCHVFVPPPVLV